MARASAVGALLVLGACDVLPTLPVNTRDGAHLIIAPHPDDEVLMATSELVRDGGVTVVVMTNGDFTCARNGWARQGESVAALQAFGRDEETLHFLGYPDNYLSSLGNSVLPDVERRLADGGCGHGHEAYGGRGFHRATGGESRRGRRSSYLSDNLVEDLADELEAERPSVITVSHGIDSHPDHAMTYIYLRQALEQLQLAPVLVKRSIIHAVVCWPMTRADCTPTFVSKFIPDVPFPDFEAQWAGYRPTSRIDLGPSYGLADVEANPKAAALGSYVTQGVDWLRMYAREEEIFWPERLVNHAGRIEREAAVPEGEACGAYSLGIEKKGLALRRGDRLLQWQQLPIDDETSDYELLVDPRPDDGERVLELTVRRNGVYRMLAVDPAASPKCMKSRGVIHVGTLSSRR